MDPFLHPYLAQSDAGPGLLAFFPMLIIFLLIYAIGTFPLYKIAQKLNIENPWIAFIPLVQIILIPQMSGKEWWWILLCFIPILGLFVGIYLWMGVSENLGYSPWMALILLVPIAGFFLLYYWALAPQPALRS